MTKKTVQFIFLTFILSWSLFGIFKIFRGDLKSSHAIFFTVLYMFCPMFAVLIIEKFIYKENIKNSCNINFDFNIWFLIAWILPLVISFASLPIATLFKDVEISYSFEGFLDRVKDNLNEQRLSQLKQQLEELSFGSFSFWILQSLLVGATINALAAFGEEVGWRGLLFNELYKNLGFWKTSFILGFIWGLWHLPLIIQGYNYPSNPYLGILWMIIFCILYTPILNFIRIKSNSVIPCAVLHGTINATYGFSILFLKGSNEFIVGVLGISGFVVVLILDLIIYLNIKF